jgi:nucleoside-diphosphate-sugar epimerase
VAKILVTGASGFLGGAITARLAQDHAVRKTCRRAPSDPAAIAIGEIGPDTDWARALEGVEAVVHLAGLAHARHAAEDLRRVNVEGVDRLMAQARAAGVRRFIYMSSVKAALDETQGAPAREADAAAPGSAYGRSKREAELIVLDAAEMAPVIVRPPLVFAPDAKANFAALLRLAGSGAPLPLKAIANRRSLIARDSLAEAVAAVLARPEGPSGVFYIADRPAVSTPEIIAALRAGMGLGPRLFAAPGAFLKVAPRALTESLEVDDSAFRAAYGYGPAPWADVRDALRATAAAWKKAA